MKLLRVLVVITIALLSRVGFAQTQDACIYVWDFATRDYKKTRLTSNFTHDFEVALSQHGHYKILERRNSARWIAHIDNEKAVLGAAGISRATIRKLQAAQADMVVFGEVFDDVDSGVVVVTVTFQKFDGSKELLASVFLPRGTVNDAASRRKAMARLVRKLASTRFSSHGYLLRAQGCHALVNKTIVCSFSVLNHSHARVFKVCARYYSTRSYAYDDYQQKAEGTLAAFLGTRPDRCVKKMLASNQKALFSVTFHGIVDNAERVSLLDLDCGQLFRAQFFNIPIQR